MIKYSSNFQPFQKIRPGQIAPFSDSGALWHLASLDDLRGTEALAKAEIHEGWQIPHPAAE